MLTTPMALLPDLVFFFFWSNASFMTCARFFPPFLDLAFVFLAPAMTYNCMKHAGCFITCLNQSDDMLIHLDNRVLGMCIRLIYLQWFRDIWKAQTQIPILRRSESSGNESRRRRAPCHGSSAQPPPHPEMAGWKGLISGTARFFAVPPDLQSIGSSV